MELVLHGPQSGEGRRELAERVADVHARTVLERLAGPDCPAGQRQALLEAVIRAHRPCGAEAAAGRAGGRAAVWA